MFNSYKLYPFPGNSDVPSISNALISSPTNAANLPSVCSTPAMKT